MLLARTTGGQLRHPAPSDRSKVPASEVTEDTDVCKLIPVPVGVEAEQEGPFQGDEAPDTRQVVASGISQGLMLGDGQDEECAESHHGES